MYLCDSDYQVENYSALIFRSLMMDMKMTASYAKCAAMANQSPHTSKPYESKRMKGNNTIPYNEFLGVEMLKYPCTAMKITDVATIPK